MGVFAAVAFFNLGDTNYPRNPYVFTKNEPVFVDFGQIMKFQGVVFLNGASVNSGFRVYSWDGEDLFDLCCEETRAVKYRWFAFKCNITTRYVVIEPAAPGVSILEMGFICNDMFVKPVAYSPPESSLLFDEQWLIPENPSYMNDMNFDESLHTLTAYEFILARQPSEWTHPPLGKSLIAIGIKLFGMTPFGWRFMSALFGVLMIIPIFALGKHIFDSRYFAFVAAFVFAFDFMHFVQARVATLDTFLVTFILCMYLFMYKYTRIEHEKRLTPKALAYLAISGVFMGLAISVKWQGVYAGLGLAALFALVWFESRVHYISKGRKKTFIKAFFKTALWCVLFFVAVPATIYCLAYIPFARACDLPLFKAIVKNQADMLNFHTVLAENNDYQSRWWTWPLDLRPIYYYRQIMGGGKYRGVNSFGNPALWWGGFLGLIWCAKRWITGNDKTARFLCIAWAAQILPWVFVSRSTFIYHYFPCVPFLALAALYFIKTQPKRRRVWCAIAGCTVVLILFAAFHPVLSGISANIDYIRRLEWLPGWQFIGTGT